MDKTTPTNPGTPLPEAPARNEGIIPRTEKVTALILGDELARTGWTTSDIDRLLGDPFIPGSDPSIHDHVRVLLAELAGEVTVTHGGGFSARQRFNLDGGGIPDHAEHPYAVFVETAPIGQSGHWLAVTRRENIKAGDLLFCVTRQDAHLSKVAEVRASWRGFSIVTMEHEREAEASEEERSLLPASLTRHHP